MQYNYTAYTLSEGLIKGKIEADSEGEARGEVANQGYKVLKMSPARSLPTMEDMFPSLFKARTGELVRFSRQFATMVRGGSSLQRGLELLRRETRNRVMKRVLGDIIKTVNAGGVSHPPWRSTPRCSIPATPPWLRWANIPEAWPTHWSNWPIHWPGDTKRHRDSNGP